MPTFRFFLQDRNTAVARGSAAWGVSLPTSRASAGGEAERDKKTTVSRGDYFNAVRAFLEESPHHRLADAVSRRIRRSISTDDLDFVDIYLEKHGQYYHPARVLTAAAGTELNFVVNAAFAATGKALIGTDFENLQRLTRQYPYRFVPRVHQLGEVRTDSSQKKWILFLGQWMQDYHEFHLQRVSTGGAVRMIVWDPYRGGVKLTRKQTEAVYRQAARILTAYCNLATYEQVGAWHHAAGDFILRLSPKIDLKLVTVREYRPLFAGLDRDIETVFQALLLFLLNMSVRMRIDRDGGTGDLLWSEELAVPATLSGFFEGLDLQAAHDLIPEELPGHFRTYLKALTEGELTGLLAALAAKRFAAGAASDLVQRHLQAHARTVRAAI